MTLDEAHRIANPPPPYRPPPDFTPVYVAAFGVLALLAFYSLKAAVILAALCLAWRVWMARLFSRKRD